MKYIWLLSSEIFAGIVVGTLIKTGQWDSLNALLNALWSIVCMIRFASYKENK